MTRNQKHKSTWNAGKNGDWLAFGGWKACLSPLFRNAGLQALSLDRLPKVLSASGVCRGAIVREFRILFLANALWLAFGAAAWAQDGPEPDETDAGEAPAVATILDNGQGGVSLNLRGADLDTVLDRLSEGAGYVIVREATIDADINISSHQPLSPERVIDVLNISLMDKGYAAIRSDTILRIVRREDAKRHDIPVLSGSDPKSVPRKEEFVTQIIPIGYVDARELVEDLEPLLPEDAVMTANESSNSLIVTHTQTTVRRMMEIISALDTSVSSLSEVQVFPLVYADAEDTARMVNQIFEDDQGGGGSRGRSSSSSGSSIMDRIMSMRRSSGGGR
jgi:type II secretory pathway component GspD/PulD (secretin)